MSFLNIHRVSGAFIRPVNKHLKIMLINTTHEKHFTYTLSVL